MDVYEICMYTIFTKMKSYYTCFATYSCCFFLTSLCVSTHRSVPFSLLVTKYSTIQLDQNLFNHFPKERHLYCFQFFHNPKKYLLYVLTLLLALFLIFSPFISFYHNFIIYFIIFYVCLSHFQFFLL